MYRARYSGARAGGPRRKRFPRRSFAEPTAHPVWFSQKNISKVCDNFQAQPKRYVTHRARWVCNQRLPGRATLPQGNPLSDSAAPPLTQHNQTRETGHHSDLSGHSPRRHIRRPPPHVPAATARRGAMRPGPTNMHMPALQGATLHIRKTFHRCSSRHGGGRNPAHSLPVGGGIRVD